MKNKKSNSLKTTLKKELKNKTILITGGAGSIGSTLARKILEYPIKSVRVLDINEHALFQLKRSLNSKKLRLLLGSPMSKAAPTAHGHPRIISMLLSAADPFFDRPQPSSTALTVLRLRVTASDGPPNTADTLACSMTGGPRSYLS